MGRPSKLTAKLADDICTRLRSGVARVQSAESMGLHRDSFHAWMQHGRAASLCTKRAACRAEHHGPRGGDLSYSDFSDMVERAEADAVVLNVGYVQKAAARDPVNARWWLERRCPAEFGSRQPVEVTSTAGAPTHLETARDRLTLRLAAIGARLNLNATG